MVLMCGHMINMVALCACGCQNGHLGCVYGHYLPVLREVSRYLGIHFDNAHEQGIYSL